MNIGDKMILERRGRPPAQATVEKITAKGWLRLAGHFPTLFKPGFSVLGTQQYVSIGGSDIAVPFTEERWAEVQARETKKNAAAQQRRAEEIQREQQREARLTAELAEVRAVLKDDLPIKHIAVLDDGSRVVWLTLPVRPEFIERKGATEIVVARLKDREDIDWRASQDSEEPVKVRRVEMHLAYAHAGTGSWPSTSASTHDDDEALWEAVRYVYHDSW